MAVDVEAPAVHEATLRDGETMSPAASYLEDLHAIKRTRNKMRQRTIDLVLVGALTLAQLPEVVAAKRVEQVVIVDYQRVMIATRYCLELIVQSRRLRHEHLIGLTDAALAVSVVSEGKSVDARDLLDAIWHLLEVAREQLVHLFVHEELMTNLTFELSQLVVIEHINRFLREVILHLIFGVIAKLAKLLQVRL